ncbi:hypothetical protein [Pseudomaricurvus sp. HS19]|uniref:hypothetical protein n=1 Tax=Pseudomaricurvus sp. HS19 TaxID=2692626 RepID=UPI001371D9FC|nr:hypothetical protein [Pseudomaricurvus sp. HS19]MYM62045.1 hypothetical protein [Pseudomaricurvus sp. HS19]
MELLEHLVTATRKPGLFRTHQPLFLLSHMRANTSLLGHILGSNPAICGYYEMHNGYYSWKSLLRQKLLYYRDHDLKPQAKYMFDKVLHDFHYVDMNLLNQANARIMFSAREPEKTIKSTLSQFRRERPGHEFCDTEEVCQYYCQRLQTLEQMAAAAHEYVYFDADELRRNTAELLQRLTTWLELDVPLRPEFDNFHFSGKLDSGDLSGRLASGKVEKSTSDYSDIEIPETLLEQAQDAYARFTVTMEAGSLPL